MGSIMTGLGNCLFKRWLSEGDSQSHAAQRTQG